MTEFLEQYGLLIFVTIILGVMVLSTYLRSKKYNNQMTTLFDNLKKGDYVVTVGGVYGEVEKVRTVKPNTENAVEEKIITIKASENTYLDFNVKAIQAVVNELKPKTKKVPAKKTTEKKTATKKEEK